MAGELLDTASPRLGGLRAAVRIAFDRLRRRLDSLVASELGNALQEPIITLRNGRYVVPVKAEARARVKGIVHDASGSGATLFVEPLVVVELGNAWREAQVAEQEEVERILDELSALIAANVPALRETLDALARFDFWAAKALLASEVDGSRAETAKGDEVVLLSARHPGLTGRVIPIDVRLGDGYTALVVTGPNTGGKTVTLRTLGLLALMHQAGLHVPAAPGSKLPIFRDVYADIGDEQSVAQSLSTFSGHMRSIIRIVEAAGPGTLVLLDELGAGTDPTEGSALAQALLDHFIRAGALVAATTHYAELKAYAHTAPGAMNAAVEFDLETLSPTYRLSIGLPGRSQAFAIAERLGLPEPLVADARSRLTESELAFEATLASIRETQGETADALERARSAEARATDALRTADEERRRARRERDDVTRRSREEAERIVADLRDELSGARQQLERGGLTAPAIDAVLARADEHVERLPAKPDGPPDPADAAPRQRRVWRVGERARSVSGGWEGRVVEVDRAGRRATLEAGTMRVSVPIEDLDLADATPGSRAAAESAAASGSGGGTNVAALRLARARSVPMSLDLRGARVDEALAALETYLNDASIAGLDRVTVVHGSGTGALRDAVRSQTAGHALVKEIRAGEGGEGGDGVTVVTLG
ncbi:MAG TPA: Smr/MutS family protein [Candidatus Limnocylindrales bacterium]|nr:Smr/MutS family protein [Candidatus Limnocylindrales bacterium]